MNKKHLGCSVFTVLLSTVLPLKGVETLNPHRCTHNENSQIKEEYHMPSIKDDLRQLKNDLKDYSVEKKEEIKHSIENAYEVVSNRYKSLDQAARDKLSQKHHDLMKSYYSMKETADNKLQSAYAKLLKKMDALDDKMIEESKKSKAKKDAYASKT